MSREDEDWFGELSRNPFAKKGFTPELQRKIMLEFDRKPLKKRRFYPAAGIALLLLGIGFAGYRLQVEPEPTELGVTASQVIQEVVGIENAKVQVDINSVLMLGLRDDAKAESPSYRTLVIAEKAGKLETVAEGDGILMPYGQQFWRLTAVDEAGEGSGAALKVIEIASTTSSKRAVNAITAADSGLPTVAQALIFAGNRYLTLEEWDKSSTADKQIRTRTVDLKAFAASQFSSDIGLNLETAACISDTNPNSEWMLFRQEGRWRAAVEGSGGGIFSPGGKEFTPLPAILPESLTAYDSLNLTWKQVLELEPDALDAISSPQKDMLAVLTKDKVNLYAFPDTKDDLSKASKLLTINKGNLENLIMSQWATEKYAEKWIDAGIAELGGK